MLICVCLCFNSNRFVQEKPSALVKTSTALSCTHIGGSCPAGGSSDQHQTATLHALSFSPLHHAVAHKQTLLWGWEPIKSDLISPLLLIAPSTASPPSPHPVEHTTHPAVMSARHTHTHVHAPVAPPQCCASWSTTSLNTTPALPQWPSVAKCSYIGPLNLPLLCRTHVRENPVNRERKPTWPL